MSEQHALKIVGCSPPRIQYGRLAFVYHDDTAASVTLAGDFNNWDSAAMPLAKDAKGLWFAEIETPSPGQYQYKFFVDGQRWIEDANNGMKIPDNLGGLNSVISIE